jgi:hypothetical protein
MINSSLPVTAAIDATVTATSQDPNNLFVIGGSILAAIVVISSLIAFFKNVWGFRSWVLRNCTIRRFYWYITNRKISIRIDVQRKYQTFDPNLQELLEHIQPNINGKFGRFFSPPEITRNTLQFVAERMSAPIKFSFFPDANMDDDLESDSSQIDFTIVQCKILGNLTFVYREFESYQTILSLIDELYHQIENDYHLGNPAFSNILIEASLSYDFNENWSKKDVINCDGAKILIGSKIIQANSKTISPLLHLDKYIIKISSSDMISTQ